MPLSDKIHGILEKKRNGNCARYGMCFSTDYSSYFYDSGTGRVMELENAEYEFLCLFLNGTKEELLIYVSKMSLLELSKLEQDIEYYSLLDLPNEFALFSELHFNHLNEQTMHRVEQVILEITQSCNLRCGYCIYNDEFINNRSFSNEEMSFETAQKAVDYALEHSSQEVAITFYGGEPLLRFDFIKDIVAYVDSKKNDKMVFFSITSNLTLMTADRAEFFASNDNFSVVCSIDGPEGIHDSYRKYGNGGGSFTDAYAGLSNIIAAYKKHKRKSLIINAVLAPPYTFEKLDEIETFFQALDLPPDSRIDIGYAEDDSIDDATHLNEIRDVKEYIDRTTGELNPLWNWQVIKFGLQEHSPCISINKDAIVRGLMEIHHRHITKRAECANKLNGCCVPAARRLYVMVDGNFKVCERVGNSPNIGNINDGLNLATLKHYYVDHYAALSSAECCNCWAQKLCKICYAACFSPTGVDMHRKLKVCEQERSRILKYLVLYFNLAVISPQTLDELNYVTNK